MRFSILNILGTLLVGLVCATAGFAQGGVPATKASASVANNLKLAGCTVLTIDEWDDLDCTDHINRWKKLIDTQIKPPGGKDLLITVSMETGLFDSALTSPAFIFQQSGLRVKVDDSVNGGPDFTVAPHQVTWDQELKLALDYASPFSLEDESGVRSFTFVERNAAVGVHNIEVEGRYEILAGEETECAGLLTSFAYVSHRTLTVEQVSLPPATN